MDGPTLEVVHTPAQCSVVMAGEIDYEAHGRFDKVFQSLADCPDDAAPVVVDLSGVTFLDSSGLGALVEIRRAAEARGQSVTLRGPSPSILRMLQIIGFDKLFPIEAR